MQVVACPAAFERIVGAAFKADGVQSPSPSSALELAQLSATADAPASGDAVLLATE